MQKDNKLTPISELGEFAFIDKLTEDFKSYNETVLNGIGDDAAVIKTDGKMAVSSEVFMEGIDFNLTYFPMKHLGYKVVISSISDIYAMNAKPKYILVNIGLSSKFSVEAMEELYSGIRAACDTYNIQLIGGDTNMSLTGMSISITAMGDYSEEPVIGREGAKENDIICVSGNFGAAYMGLTIMEREYKIFSENPEIQPKLEDYNYIIRRYLKPELPVEIIETLHKKKLDITSMIDVSDGLASDLMQICKSSKKGCKIYLDKLPIDDETHKVAQELEIDAFTCALNGGQDFELMFTVSLDEYEKLIDIADLSIIGHITSDENKILVTPDGNEIELKAQGWK